MNLQELRLGTVIGRKSSDYPQRVDGIKTHNIWLMCLGSHCDLSTDDVKNGVKDLYKIKITEDWLLSAGFEQKYTFEDRTWFKKGKWLFELRDKLFFLNENDDDEEDFIKVEFVNRLQNIWFDLNNKELEFKHYPKHL